MAHHFKSDKQRKKVMAKLNSYTVFAETDIGGVVWARNEDEARRKARAEPLIYVWKNADGTRQDAADIKNIGRFVQRTDPDFKGKSLMRQPKNKWRHPFHRK